MDLREVSPTTVSPYRCYVRGNIIQTEGENVQTIGFKDGIAVLQVIPPISDMQKFTDNMIDSKAIDLTKLKKIVVKVDPKTGKKYIDKDGRRIEILPQITNPILSLQGDNSVKVRTITTGPAQGTNTVTLLNGPRTYQRSMRVVDMKYQLVPTKRTQGVDIELQTDSLEKKEVCTQTEPLYSDGRESPFSETFFNFILGADTEADRFMPRKMIDPSKLQTKEEIHKFNFFNDMRNALNFDRSGNLPIHDNVMQNNLKAVQKSCIVLRAVKESVNILNQQGYAPLHLAISHDVSLEIVKVLLHHHADINLADHEGNTAIHLAIEHRRHGLLKILINGAKDKKLNLDLFNYEGFTPLILACLNHSYDDASFLLDKGSDPNVKDMKSGRTALFHAAEGHDVNLVELLMQNKADTKIRNFFGTSPHDAMFELEEMPLKIKFCILGRDHQRFQNKKKIDAKPEHSSKKAKLQTTPILRKVTTSDLIGKSKRK